jgi:hypothetical protein
MKGIKKMEKYILPPITRDTKMLDLCNNYLCCISVDLDKTRKLINILKNDYFDISENGFEKSEDKQRNFVYDFSLIQNLIYCIDDYAFNAQKAVDGIIDSI